VNLIYLVAFLSITVGAAPAAAEPFFAPVASVVAATDADSLQLGWPREIQQDGYAITMYQPQVDSFENDRLTSRAAVSVTKDAGEPVFGAVWITARVETDREERLVTIADVRVPRVRFPESTPEQEAGLAEILEREIPQWELTMSLDRLLTDLEDAEQVAEAADLATTPPAIVYRDVPAVLVLIDGDAIMQRVEGSSLMRVINTPFLIVLVPSAGRYYLYAGADTWYEAVSLEAGWSISASVPTEVMALAPQEEPAHSEETKDEDDAPTDDRTPEIVLATEPTELLYTDGDPEFVPVADLDLMYVSNSDSDLLFEPSTGSYYVLLSGRWYRNSSLASSGWEYLASDSLPESFAAIPADSDVGDVRVHVAGTEEAYESVLDAQIPQTAAVSRHDIDLQVEYDGDPQFRPIEGTDIEYAVNSPFSVLLIGDQYWVCHDGVWYLGASAAGPWEVATARPDEVDGIPADNPNYNVKYVYVYDSTPDVVYVGYLPAYTGSYIYGPTIVYGTGYWYRPWYGAYYYPRPVTYGYHVRWNPWTGWAFGVSFSNGPFTFGIGFGGYGAWYGGWWGPIGYRGYARGYHRGYYHGWHRGYYHGYRAGMAAAYRSQNIYRSPRPETRGAARPVTRDVRAGATRPATRDVRPGAGQARPSTRDTPATRPADRSASGRAPSVSRDRANNVYTDRSGNVYRRDNQGTWQQRGQGGWSRPSTGAQPSTRDRSGAASRPSTNQLNRDHSARQRGTQRSSSYENARRSGGGGAARGGGRRR
jgi:hypothetical protein